MTTPQHEKPEADDAEDWLARLRASRNAEPTAENEEDRAMYHAIIQHHQQQEAQLLKDAQSDDHAWQQMRFRLKKEGLFQAGISWKTWMPMAMAAALLASVALPNLMPPGIDVLDSPPAALRGGGMSIKAHEPLKTAKRIAQKIKALDPNLRLHWFGGVATIDVELDANKLDQAEAIIRTVSEPGREIRLKPGFNRLEFTAHP